MNHTSIISKELNLKTEHVAAVVGLLESGASIPFVARYRKEMSGSMDEVNITAVRDRMESLLAFDKRKEAILKSLEERELLTRDLKNDISRAASLTILEDIYEKYRPKKRTRAQAAKEKGLEPLALFLLKQNQGDIVGEAGKYISLSDASGKQEVSSEEDALSGARDIIAEMMSEDADLRGSIRKLFLRSAQISSRVKKSKESEAAKFKDYFDWNEPAFKAPSHRIHAMLRGQKESMLTLHVLPDEASALSQIEKRWVKNSSPAADQVKEAVKDAYKRLLSKSIEKECISELKKKADETAISVFAKNLNALLLSAPMGQKKIMAIDPGFRTGCKVVCLDAQGKLLHHDVIFPFQGRGEKAGQQVKSLIKRYRCRAIAIGNGTAGRESEEFIRKLGLDKAIDVVMVDESGASIYSASKTAREEFPDHDVTVRGAVSIGRRLMDPLAELVKLDPKSIGVGQYQHDVDPKLLNSALDDVVISCVNQVGVEANTASRQLLCRVSGLNDTIAANMVKYRDENGAFKTRKEFLKVARLGPRAFEQAAGFLRIHGASNPLDESGVHPESYEVVEAMAKDCGVGIKELTGNPVHLKRMDLNKYRTSTIGMPTLKDISAELQNPGRDPRKEFISFSFDDTIHEIKDLVPGMKVPGIVTNVTAFGAFVDIGVHQDGLVHISQMADRFIKDPNEVVTVRDTVMVTVLEVDAGRKRISLSLKQNK